MQQSTTSQAVLTMDSSAQEARDVLTAILRHGAQQMLAAAIDTLAAEKRWRRLNGSALLPEVICGVRFVDAIKEMAA